MFRPQILLFRGDFFFFFLFLNAKKIKLLGATARNSGSVNFNDLNFREELLSISNVSIATER